MANNLSAIQARLGPVVQTTDGTATTGAIFATESDKSYIVTAKVIATEVNDHDETAGYLLTGVFKNDGGTLSLIGSVSQHHVAEDTAGWNATLDANGTDIRIRVTGAASTTVNWRSIVDIQEIE